MTPLRGWVFLAASLLSCGVEPSEDARCAGADPDVRSAVITELGFVRRAQGEQVKVEGFDLDGRPSNDQDPLSCHHPDAVSPSGERGIDNQLALLLPVIDEATGGAVDSTLQAVINNGQLLVALTVERPAASCSGDAVLVFRRVNGVPFVGADLRLDPGQTFDVMHHEAQTRVEAQLRDGVLETGPFTLALPIALLNAQFTLNLYNARVRVRTLPDGGMEGVIGGGVSREEMVAELRAVGNLPESLIEQMAAVMFLFADLEPLEGGECSQLSCAVRFAARPAFVNP